MIAWFRRKRPAPPTNPILVGISRADLLVASYNNYTPDQWSRLPELVKADLREQIVYAIRRPK